jgi:hypothetical protein
MNAVDTNILLYAVDEDEPAKRRQARVFLRRLVDQIDCRRDRPQETLTSQVGPSQMSRSVLRAAASAARPCVSEPT